MADGGGHRPIDSSDFASLGEVSDVGAAPMLQWVKVADLVVDDAYQRPIAGAGRTNVRRIAQEFRWSKFAPVILAPVPGGKFAVIDGQHRATAARLRGIAEIPAQVIIADQGEQAAAFKSINGQVTRMNKLALHHAAIAAADEAAIELQVICEAASVTIIRYPKPIEKMLAGETMALATLAWGLSNYGRETVITALQCVTETDNNRPNMLSAAIVRALFTVLGANHAWRDAGGDLLAAFDDIDLEEELEEARVTRRPKGTVTSEILADRLHVKLSRALAGRVAA